MCQFKVKNCKLIDSIALYNDNSVELQRHSEFPFIYENRQWAFIIDPKREEVNDYSVDVSRYIGTDIDMDSITLFCLFRV